MGDYQIKFLVNKENLASWVDAISASCGCEPTVLIESSEETDATYQKVVFTRANEALEVMSLPGPKDRCELFLLVLGLRKNETHHTDELSHSLFQDLAKILVEVMDAERIGLN